jgi:hypothetical protein
MRHHARCFRDRFAAPAALVAFIGAFALIGASCGNPSPAVVNGSDLSAATQTTSGCDGTTTGSTTGGQSSGGASGGGESWVWLFTDYANGLNTLKAKSASFTHVSPALYHMNYAYKTGVPSFTSGPSDGCTSNPTTVDNFNGLTSRQIAQKVHAMNMKVVPLIYGGSLNCGTDQGIENVLNDSPAGTQTKFINALVTEAVDKGYDGWNLDWEAALGKNPYAPLLITFLGNAQKAFAAKNLLLTIDILASGVEQSWCSGGNGFVDLGKIGPVVDGVVIESYESSMGSKATACPANLANPLVCNYPSATVCPSGECVNSDLALLCAHLPLNKAIIGLDAVPWGTNPIAGTAVTTVEDYGFKRIAVWPDWNNNGPNGTYQLMDAKGIVPATTDWYTLLSNFLKHWN